MAITEAVRQFAGGLKKNQKKHVSWHYENIKKGR